MSDSWSDSFQTRYVQLPLFQRLRHSKKEILPQSSPEDVGRMRKPEPPVEFIPLIWTDTLVEQRGTASGAGRDDSQRHIKALP